MSGELVLVTGGSGFVAAHCILQVAAAGYRVRATLRTMSREGDVRSMLARGGLASGAPLSFVAADLFADAGWDAAVAGATHVLHVASPFPSAVPRHEDELIVPARDGALRVLRAARDARVKRFVLTSSFAAIGYGHAPTVRSFDETDWTDPTAPGLTAYTKSKTLAERAAWDFMAREGGAMELSVVNPVVVLGPLLGPDRSSSIELVRRMMQGGVPLAPRLWLGVVDVRDVADLHLKAMTHPAAAGERFLAVAGNFLNTIEIAAALRSGLGNAASKTPRREAPDWLVRLLAHLAPAAGLIVPELGKEKNAGSAKAQRLLGWSPRPAAEAVRAAGESLLRLGLVKSG